MQRDWNDGVYVAQPPCCGYFMAEKSSEIPSCLDITFVFYIVRDSLIVGVVVEEEQGSGICLSFMRSGCPAVCRPSCLQQFLDTFVESVSHAVVLQLPEPGHRHVGTAVSA